MLRLAPIARQSRLTLSRSASTVATSSQHSATTSDVPSSSYDPQLDPQLAGLGCTHPSDRRLMPVGMMADYFDGAQTPSFRARAGSSVALGDGGTRRSELTSESP